MFGTTHLIEPSASGNLGFYLHEISTWAGSGPDAYLSGINILFYVYFNN